LRTTGFKQLNPGCQLRKNYFVIKDAAGTAQVSALPGGRCAFLVLLHGGCNRLEVVCVTFGRKGRLLFHRAVISDCPCSTNILMRRNTMTRNNCVALFDLALAVLSIGLFVVTVVSLAHHSVDSLDAIFLGNGTMLGAVVGVMRFLDHREPWPITILRPAAKPVPQTAKPGRINIFRWWGKTGSAQPA
jgi:hypothetical protein